MHGEAAAAVVHGEAGAGVVVRHAQQSSFVHPVAAQTGSPGILVQGAGGQVKEEQVKCVVVVHGVVVGCKQQSSADGVPWRLYACGRCTHPAGHWKVVQVGGATVVQGAAGGGGPTVAQGLEQETRSTTQAKRSARSDIVNAHTVPKPDDQRAYLPTGANCLSHSCCLLYTIWRVLETCELLRRVVYNESGCSLMGKGMSGCHVLQMPSCKCTYAPLHSCPHFLGKLSQMLHALVWAVCSEKVNDT